MRVLDVLRMAGSALVANRGRSLLTVLSITIGAFAIVVMSSLADSGFRTLEKGIEELGGARILFVAPKKPERGEGKETAYAKGFTLTDRDRTFEGIPHVEAISLFARMGRREVSSEKGVRARTSVVAGDAGFFNVFHMRVGRGRSFTDDENRGRASVCVVGHKLAERIGLAEADPLGGFLTVGEVRCRIIGVFADNERFGTNFGFDWTNLVVLPSESMSDHDPSVATRAMMFVKTDDPRSNEIVKRLVNARLSARHPGLDDFTLVDFSGIMGKFRAVFAGMEVVVALLAGIALLVGGVGVMNMMLVAVSERVKEIGVKKALGAPPRAIGAQFLAEAVLLSMFGGGFGVASGVGVATLASILISRALGQWSFSLAPTAAISALAVTMVIGVGFGWLPAKRAAALDPIEAMRQ